MDNFFIRGDEFLRRENPNFKLVGRANELKELSSILMRGHANSILLVGPGGVGCSALCVGLQASKGINDIDTSAPFDIVSKRLFWLDTDELFSTGNAEAINQSFQRMMDTLSRTPDSVLIIEETRDFIEAARNNGSMHFINALTLAVKKGKTQMILQARDEDLDAILKCRSDIHECYTLLDLEEPTGQNLLDIVRCAAEGLQAYHKIEILPEAIEGAIEMTNKHRNRDMGLSSAQPQRAITLLDRALATYRFEEHSRPANVANGEWKKQQKELKNFYKQLRAGEVEVIKLEQAIAKQQEEESNRKRIEATDEDVKQRIKKFEIVASQGGYDSEELKELKSRLRQFQANVEENKREFEKRTAQINADLKLNRQLILREFSRISGINVDKLDENERVKLSRLEDDLSKRVFGQKAILTQVANGVKVAKLGRKTDQPLPFLFMGPSGVGKTELAKALAACLLDDERALTRFDMSEYMEKHAVAKLIGAPPGYEGFDVGGILTNAMRKNPHRVLLFDEIEKAHPDVFNIFLQILSDGRLTDNVGRLVPFNNAIVVMTTNIGQQHFLQDDFDEAKKAANEELNSTYRSEFLNRFNGRENIYCFMKLDLDSMQRIVRREINSIDNAYVEQGIKTTVNDDDIASFCMAKYDPTMGARGLPGYIKANLEPIIVNNLLGKPNVKGELIVHFNAEKKAFDAQLIETNA